MKDKPILVLAGTFDQYRDWLRRNEYSRKDYVMVHDERSILGHKDTSLYLIGTWDMRSYRTITQITLYAVAHCIEVIDKSEE